MRNEKPRKKSRRLAFDSLEDRMVLSSPDLAPSLGAPPPPSSGVVWVNTEASLQNALNNLQSGQTVVIQKGTYNLSNTLYVGKNRAVSNVTIRGESDDFNDVVLLGKGMDNAGFGGVPMGISVHNAQDVTIANLSIGQVYYHPIELKGDSGASNVQVYHTRLFDAGEQFLKANPGAAGVGVNDSSVRYSLIEYTAGTPKTDHGGGVGYTNGIDVHAGRNWDIADNLIRNLHTPDSAASFNYWNPAILIWNGSSNVTVERNTIIDCDRAVAMGLVDRAGTYDAQNGIVRNNFISMSPGLLSASRKMGADAAIIAWDSPGAKVLHNTLLLNGNAPNSIQARFASTGIQVLNNLADAPHRDRDGAAATLGGNYWGATSGMFANPSAGDLHLVSNGATQASVINKVTSTADDWDGTTRPTDGNGADIGADEYGAAPAPPPPAPPAGGRWTQTSAADFNAGTQGATAVTDSAGGEVQLAQGFSEEFDGGALGSSWSTSSYGPRASYTVSGGVLSVAGGAAYSRSTFSGVPVEGLLNIGAATYQHFGLATGLNSVAGNSWAIFSTMGTTNTLYVRVNSNGATTDVAIGSLPTGYHNYRVNPVSGGYQFLIDGVLRKTVSRSTPSGTPMMIAISSLNASTGTAVKADWVRAGSTASSGTFTSSVFDAGRTATWGSVSWTASQPAGTSIVVETISSNDGNNWSSWSSASNGGSVSSPAGRFLRYRVRLVTTDPAVTPTFSDITINWT